jgi:hypothetical protein
MEYRHLAGTLLVISIFVLVGVDLIRTPLPHISTLNKAAISLHPLLKERVGLELPLESIKSNSTTILQALGSLAIVGAIGALWKNKLALLLLTTLTLLAALTELPILYAEPLQKKVHFLNLLKTLGVLGGLILLFSQTKAARPRQKN